VKPTCVLHSPDQSQNGYIVGHRVRIIKTVPEAPLHSSLRSKGAVASMALFVFFSIILSQTSNSTENDSQILLLQMLLKIICYDLQLDIG